MINYSAFSSDGSALAGCVSTSSVRFWNTESSAPSQEYVPSSNLSSACSCINWLNFNSTKPSSKRKSHSQRLADLRLVAIGTLSGSILLYSTSKSQLHSQLDGAHSVAITSLASSPEFDELYSAASDGVVARWSLTKSVLLEKWKVEKHGVHSMCLCPTSRLLLTASRTLKLWNIDTQQLLCTFGAHKSKIICVRELLPSATPPASPPSSPLPNASSWPNSRSDLFFVSAASQDTHIYLWRVPCVDAESGEKNDASASANSAPLASFSLGEEPLVFTVAQLADQVFIIAAVTVSGQLLLFEYTLNGSRSNALPMSPVKRVCVEREEKRRKHRQQQQSATGASGALSSVEMLPIVNVHMARGTGGELELVFAFGNELALVIERVGYETLNIGENRFKRSMESMETSLTLVSDTSSTAVANHSGVSILSTQEALKVKQPVISKETTFAAGFCAPVNTADVDPHASLAVSLLSDGVSVSSSTPASGIPDLHRKSKRKRLEDSTASAGAGDISIGETQPPSIEKSLDASQSTLASPVPPADSREQLPAMNEAEQRAIQRVADAAGTSGSGGASSDALVFLLRQALQSGDTVLLKAALDYHHSQVTIVNTVRRMAADLVLPLIQVISLRLQDKTQQSNFRLLFWLKTVLTTHMAYLSSQTAMVGQLSALLQLFGSRTALLGEWCRLQGKLQLVLDQTGQRRDAVEGSSLKAGTRAIVGSLPLPGGGLYGTLTDSVGALVRLAEEADRDANTTAVYYSASEDEDDDDESDLVSVHDAFALDDLEDEDFDLLSDDAAEVDQPEFETSAFLPNALDEAQEHGTRDNERSLEQRDEESAEEESAASEADPNNDEANTTGHNARADSELLPEFIAVGSSEERSASSRHKQKKSSARSGGACGSGRRVGWSPVDARPLHSSRSIHKSNAFSQSSKQSNFHKQSKKQRN